MISFPAFWLGSVVIYLVMLGLVSWSFWSEINSDPEDVIWSLAISIVPLVNLMLSVLYLFLIGVWLVQERKTIVNFVMKLIR